MLKRLRPRSGFKAWAVVLVVLFVLVFVVAGLPYLIAGDDARRPEAVHLPTNLELPAGVELEDLVRVEVEEVVDGDTIDILIGRRSVRIRYFGIDTPERGDRCSREALDRNAQLAGEEVLLMAGPREEDEFGRFLRYVFTIDGISIEATLAAEGLGLAWRRDGQYREEIITLEAEAEAASRGCLWS